MSYPFVRGIMMLALSSQALLPYDYLLSSSQLPPWLLLPLLTVGLPLLVLAS